MPWIAAPALLMIATLIVSVGRLELRFRRGLASSGESDQS
jgi:hypothetical protein